MNQGLFVAGRCLSTDAQGIDEMLPLIIVGSVALVALGLGFFLTRLSPPPPANRSELRDRIRRLP